MKKAKKVRRDFKRVFLKKGTCSRTFFYLLNREFGHPLENEERAADPLAGGILQQGYQCGMVWGASFALGAEAYRRLGDRDRAIGLTIKATQHLMDSFLNRTDSLECSDIANCDWSNKVSFAKFMFTGKFWACFKLADKWAPEAFEAAADGLSLNVSDLPQQPISCASEVVRKMGGTDAEMAMVAGLAGGIGLSGSGCGALGAAIWMNTLARVREQKYKYAMSDPVLDKILNVFYEQTDYEMECKEITGKQFRSVAEHTEFIKNGGCEKLINVLGDMKSISTK
jgi:hypothetical protein